MREGATSLPPAAVASVIDALRRGEPWRRALETAAVAAGAADALESIAAESCGNWVWLTSFERHDAALDVGGAISSMAPALSRHFTLVHHVESSPLLCEFAARRFAQDQLANVVVSRGSPCALPFRDESFDCVAVHGAAATTIGTARGAAAAATLVDECRRVLRSGGRAYVALENPSWYGRRGSRVGGNSERAIARAVRQAGFRELDRYFAFPTFDRPRVIVPGIRRAAVARETVEARGRLRRAVRIGAAVVGLHAVLSPALIFVARK